MDLKHDSINYLIESRGAKTYLEFGYANGANFSRINCESKVAFDPNPKKTYNILNEVVMKSTSDEFFAENKMKFDVIFIDGDHTAEQVEKDIINAYGALNKDGVLILHDVRPFTKEMQEIPRKQEQWTGDVWKAFVGFLNKYPKVETGYIEEKYGLGLIYRTKGIKTLKKGFIEKNMTYEEFENSWELLYL